eukprot:4380317-Pyramimonas_sp.AAC.1
MRADTAARLTGASSDATTRSNFQHRGGPAPLAVHRLGAPGGRLQQTTWRLSPAPLAVYRAGAPGGWNLRSNRRSRSACGPAGQPPDPACIYRGAHASTRRHSSRCSHGRSACESAVHSPDPAGLVQGAHTSAGCRSRGRCRRRSRGGCATGPPRPKLTPARSLRPPRTRGG